MRECLVLQRLTELRAFGAAVLRAAVMAEKEAPCDVVLVLDAPGIGVGVLEDEWTAAGKIIRPEIWRRMALAGCKDGALFGWPETPTAAEWEHWTGAKRDAAKAPLRRERGGEVFHDILRVLLREWMTGGGAMSGKALGEAAGCSHPTLGRALRRLARWLDRTRPPVALTRFPTEEWQRLLVSSDRIRSTARFAMANADVTVETLEQAIRALRRDDIWLGGVTGARRYFPALDLVGTPRLDVSMPATGRQPDISWTADLGLRPAADGEAVLLAVHAVHFPGARGEKSVGRRWADPVECLLDLHEARLESQALEFLTFFTNKTKSL